MSIVDFPQPQRRTLHGEIRLDGQDVDVLIGGGLVACDEELSIVSGTGGERSPTVRLEVFDPKRTLIRSGLLELRRGDTNRLRREVELMIDGVAYWLRHVRKQQDNFVLTFLDREAARMSRRRGAMRVRARTLDHRRFIAQLCERSGAPAPVTAEPGPREIAARERAGIGTRLRLDGAQRDRDERRAPGLADRASVRIKGELVDAEQVRNLNVGLTEALAHSPPPLALVTLVAAGIVESSWRNIQGSGYDSVSFGVLQNIPGRSAGVDGTMTRAQALDVAYSVRSALLPPGPTSAGGLIRVSKQQPDVDAGTLADICINGLGVGDPKYPAKVNKYVPEAERIIQAFAGGAGLRTGLAGVAIERTFESPLTVERGETDLEAATRTAEAYGFRFFIVANRTYYLADEALMASRPRMTLSEDSAGVDWVDWEWAPLKQLRRTELTCRVEAWQAPPGSVVLLDETNGPAGVSDENPDQGRWLVGSYRRNRFEPGAEVTLIKGERPTVPTETETETIGGGSPESSGPVGRDGFYWPLGRRGSIIGTPYSGTHTIGNWQSDNAIDIGVPDGTPVMAVGDGRVEKVSGGYSGGASRFDGFQVTLSAWGNRWFYTHLAEVAVRAGDRVRAGDVIGRSGSANGVPHLHLGVERGDPRKLLGIE